MFGGRSAAQSVQGLAVNVRDLARGSMVVSTCDWLSVLRSCCFLLMPISFVESSFLRPAWFETAGRAVVLLVVVLAYLR